MSFPSVNPVKTNAWKELKNHFSEIKNLKMQELFLENPKRAEQFSATVDDFFLDYSKNKINQKTIDLLLQLAEETQLKEAIEAQFSGEKINQTENRAVLHTDLRNFDKLPAKVKKTLIRMKKFSKSVISGTWKGYTDKKITDVVNIGIGGSDLGPQMVCEALQFYKTNLGVHFISNIDGDHVQEILNKLNPETTVFIVVSKSFSTQETLTNAETVRNWFLKRATVLDIEKHFVAVSANAKAAAHFGIAPENVFPMWDWVGGRFSLWSAVGLSICCSIGYKNFEKLLHGAHQMDAHFKNTAFTENMPVLMALLSIWYNNFFEYETEAIVPYSESLKKFIPYLQQAMMESNGKSVDRNGDAVNYQTGTIVWGTAGTNAQHAFFQLLHQGTKPTPIDFIAFTNSLYSNNVHHHQILLANCFAQAEALLNGTYNENMENPFKYFEGNKPSNTLLIKELTPENLGGLIALYEHKLFVQGVIWNIFSYDQWGVELGKKIADQTLEAIQNKNLETVTNSSTKLLLKCLYRSGY